MADRIDFYFDVGSPYSYLAYTQMAGLAKRTGAAVNYRPMLLGAVFKATGNASPADIPAKRRYLGEDLQRHADYYGAPFAPNPHFPINTLALMRGCTATQRDGGFDSYVDAVFRAIWVDGKNMSDPAVVATVLGDAGLDAGALFTRIGEQAIKDRLKADTDAALARGIFGVPTFFVGEAMFFGQDRLAFVEAAAVA